MAVGCALALNGVAHPNPAATTRRRNGPFKDPRRVTAGSGSTLPLRAAGPGIDAAAPATPRAGSGALRCLLSMHEWAFACGARLTARMKATVLLLAMSVALVPAALAPAASAHYVCAGSECACPPNNDGLHLHVNTHTGEVCFNSGALP